MKVAVAVLIACALAVGGWHVRNVQGDHALVKRYCEYGAVSRAQLEGCRGHVSAAYVRASRTAAARFAIGKGDCGPDAGPFCGGRRGYRRPRSRSPFPGNDGPFPGNDGPFPGTIGVYGANVRSCTLHA